MAKRHCSRKRGGPLQDNSELPLIENENLSRTVLKRKVENMTGVPSFEENPVLEADADSSALLASRQPDTSTTASRSSVPHIPPGSNGLGAYSTALRCSPALREPIDILRAHYYPDFHSLAPNRQRRADGQLEAMIVAHATELSAIMSTLQA